MSMTKLMEEDRAESLRLIRDSAGGLAPRKGDRRRIRALRFKAPGFDPAVWRTMGELGWIGLRLPDSKGGASLGMAESCGLAEELGAALTPEPLVQGALSAALLAAADRPDLLARLLAGECLVLTAWQERALSLDVQGSPDAPRCFLPYAGGADFFLVPVRTGSGVLSLHLLSKDAAAIDLADTQDGGQFGTLHPVPGEILIADLGQLLGDALDEAILATAAQLLGVMDQAFGLTLDYLRTREQFGRPIGSFQVLKHRAVDLKIQIALTRASIAAAAAALDAPLTSRRQRHAAVSRAKARASEAAMLVTRQAIQLHGGIGYTDEADIGLYLRKAMVLANQFGSAEVHRRRFATYAGDDD
ncbi:MAG: acyl-CoA dehydrogenase family protein [Bradyrhizobiaceae bacterium]|nr:acyl-CoA dehydrogenase family protein [Bradyrhizobiaceae bacterium]